MVAGVDLSPSHSALILLPENGGTPLFYVFDNPGAKTKVHIRFGHAEWMFGTIKKVCDEREDLLRLVALEDYALGMGEHVSYQIAETSGVFKYKVLSVHWPLCLINPRKLKSFVLRQKKVEKEDVIAWAAANGFPIPAKQRGVEGSGFLKQQREDLADAFVLAKMGELLNTYLSEGTPPRKGDIFLDPDTGLAFRDDLLFNNLYEEELRGARSH